MRASPNYYGMTSLEVEVTLEGALGNKADFADEDVKCEIATTDPVTKATKWVLVGEADAPIVEVETATKYSGVYKFFKTFKPDAIKHPKIVVRFSTSNGKAVRVVTSLILYPFGEQLEPSEGESRHFVGTKTNGDITCTQTLDITEDGDSIKTLATTDAVSISCKLKHDDMTIRFARVSAKISPRGGADTAENSKGVVASGTVTFLGDETEALMRNSVTMAQAVESSVESAIVSSDFTDFAAYWPDEEGTLSFTFALAADTTDEAREWIVDELSVEIFGRAEAATKDDGGGGGGSSGGSDFSGKATVALSIVGAVAGVLLIAVLVLWRNQSKARRLEGAQYSTMP